MPKLDDQTIELALFALVALAMLVQAIVMFAAFIVFRKAAASTDEKIEQFRTSITPLIDNSRALLARLTPRIEETADDLSAIAHSLRVQSAEIESTTSVLVARARVHAIRLDGMLTHVLDTLERTGNFVSDAVNKPMRQFSAILASVKAVVESLRSGVPRSGSRSGSRSNRADSDQDMFV
jgi:septal ring factor EnvC (AmiA/AmiB activator)